jgi:hypothetical protein
VGDGPSNERLSCHSLARCDPVRAHGSPAFGQYHWNEERGWLVAHGITVLTFEGEQIYEITAFLNSAGFARFGLASELSL